MTDINTETDYLRFSQGVRKEIETNSGLIDILRRHMSGEELMQKIGEGTKNNVYRAGRLENGLWIILRQHKFVEYPYLLTIFENYAVTAERYFLKGKTVPKFCIGLVNDENVGLLVEDLTEGGKNKLIPSENYEVEYIDKKGKWVKVYLDLDEYVSPQFNKH